MGLSRPRRQAHHRPRRDRPAECDRASPRLHRRLVLPLSQRPHPGHRRDAKGRKQYRYHDAFRGRQDKKKYLGTIEFGAALPKLRRKVEQDLGGKPTSRDAVLAAVVRLLDTEFIRIGNETYAKENKSFGATTLRSRHVTKSGAKLLVKFKGKHGIPRELAITDAKLKRVVSKITELPGQNLFQYVAEDGETCAVSSSDVNDYIREATGGDFTAKNFRTWGASVIAFDQLLSAQEEEVRKISLKTVLEPVAEALGNTPAISRKSYVHPKLIEAAREDPKTPARLHRPSPRPQISLQRGSRPHRLADEGQAQTHRQGEREDGRQGRGRGQRVDEKGRRGGAGGGLNLFGRHAPRCGPPRPPRLDPGPAPPPSRRR